MYNIIGLVLTFLAGCAFLLLLIGLAEATGFGGMFIFPLVAPVAVLALFAFQFWRHSETDRADYRPTLYAATFSAPAVVFVGVFFAGLMG